MKDYLAILDEAWAMHLTPRASDAPTVISTFAGCGGSSLGYSMAGYRELLAAEWDDNAAKTFRLNFPDVTFYEGDIANLSVNEALTSSGIAEGELDVLDGSPPCQGFSTAGKRDMHDPRSQLFREYIRLLRGLMPRTFVMENVSGMIKGKMKLTFVEILRQLKESGYQVSARLLNTQYFNVPQTRERIIFIGTRNDLNIVPSHPKPAMHPVSVRQALAQIKTDGDCFAPIASGRVPEMMKFCQPGKSLAASLKIPSFFSWVRAPLDAPCMTVQKSVTFGGFSVWHPTENRSLSGRELARIGSWPDSFQFLGNYRDWTARIGNSVPPLFMRAIAHHIRSAILEKTAS